MAAHLALTLQGWRTDPGSKDQSDLLATIESDVIPQLLRAHRADPLGPAPCANARLPPTAQEVFEFARMATCHDLAGALAFIESICLGGLSLEAVLLDLIAPTARLLGEQWQGDLRSFTEVSAGLGTLQQVVHILGPSFAPALPHRGLVVLLAAPGEQHTLGLYLLGEFLRRAGWGVQVTPVLSKRELVTLLASEHVEMVGISVSNDDLLDSVTPLIEEARLASRNPGLMVMLGGSLDLSDYAARHAALCVVDPRDAVRWLEDRGKLRRCLS